MARVTFISLDILMLLGFQLVVQSTGTGHDPVCENLRTSQPVVNESASHFSIFAIGLTQKRILLITRDLNVYDLKPSSFDGQKHQLKLKDGKPEPLCKKWSKLCPSSSNEFPATAPHAFTVSQNNMDYLFVLKKPQDTGNFIYSIDGDQVLDHVNYYETSGYPQPWVSAGNSPNSFPYNMVVAHAAFDTVQIVRMPFGDISDGMELIISKELRMVCTSIDTPNQMIINKTCNPSKNEQNVKWPIMGGFVANKMFYLFGSNRVVYIFSESSYDYGKNLNYTTIGFENFFVCPRLPTTVKNITKTRTTSSIRIFKETISTSFFSVKSGNSAIKTLLVVGIIILVIIVVIVCGLLLCLKPPTVQQQQARPSKSSKRKMRAKNNNNDELENDEGEDDHNIDEEEELQLPGAKSNNQINSSSSAQSIAKDNNKAIPLPKVNRGKQSVKVSQPKVNQSSSKSTKKSRSLKRRESNKQKNPSLKASLKATMKESKHGGTSDTNQSKQLMLSCGTFASKQKHQTAAGGGASVSRKDQSSQSRKEQSYSKRTSTRKNSRRQNQSVSRGKRSASRNTTASRRPPSPSSSRKTTKTKRTKR